MYDIDYRNTKSTRLRQPIYVAWHVEDFHEIYVHHVGKTRGRRANRFRYGIQVYGMNTINTINRTRGRHDADKKKKKKKLNYGNRYVRSRHLTLSGPQSRFGDKVLEIWAVCPQNGTAVLKGLIPGYRRLNLFFSICIDSHPINRTTSVPFWGTKPLEFHVARPQKRGSSPKGSTRSIPFIIENHRVL